MTYFAAQDIRSYNRSQYCAQNDPLTLIRSDGLEWVSASPAWLRCLARMRWWFWWKRK